jgi:hypothetical protein
VWGHDKGRVWVWGNPSRKGGPQSPGPLHQCSSSQAKFLRKWRRRNAGCGRSQDGENLPLILCLVWKNVHLMTMISLQRFLLSMALFLEGFVCVVATPSLGASLPSPQHSSISSQARRHLPYLIIVRRGRLRGFFTFPGVWPVLGNWRLLPLGVSRVLRVSILHMSLACTRRVRLLRRPHRVRGE